MSSGGCWWCSLQAVMLVTTRVVGSGCGRHICMEFQVVVVVVVVLVSVVVVVVGD